MHGEERVASLRTSAWEAISTAAFYLDLFAAWLSVPPGFVLGEEYKVIKDVQGGGGVKLFTMWTPVPLPFVHSLRAWEVSVDRAVARSAMHSCVVFASSFEKPWLQLNSFSLNQITARLVARSVWSTPELVKCMVVKTSRGKNLKKYIIDNIIIQYYWYDFYSLLWQFIIINSFIQKLSSTLFKSTARTLELQILELHDN